QMGTMRNPLVGMDKPLDPLSKFDMKELDIFKQYPDPKGMVLNPGFFHGSFGSDPAYHAGTIFHYVQTGTMLAPNIWDWPTNPELAQPGLYYAYGTPLEGNTTLVARDLVTGQVKWTYFYKETNVRGFPIVTGNMVVMGHPDGNLRFVDESTGKLLRTFNLGASMGIGLTAGKDSDGNTKIFVLVGTAGASGISPTLSSGTLVALGLSETSPKTVTNTVSATTTVTTATTNTVTAIPSTTTVTSQVTETVGLPVEITYGAVGVAVVAIVAAAILLTRKRA
ncbi:MAG TPA: hypothetical protein VJ044_06845, partial [Candidatus Hodarchaeales archaeon]|nr:hypothetical protein [Candidatus Hodarchaeales archaeon]